MVERRDAPNFDGDGVGSGRSGRSSGGSTAAEEKKSVNCKGERRVEKTHADDAALLALLATLFAPLATLEAADVARTRASEADGMLEARDDAAETAEETLLVAAAATEAALSVAVAEAAAAEEDESVAPSRLEGGEGEEENEESEDGGTHHLLSPAATTTGALEMVLPSESVIHIVKLTLREESVNFECGLERTARGGRNERESVPLRLVDRRPTDASARIGDRGEGVQTRRDIASRTSWEGRRKTGQQEKAGMGGGRGAHRRRYKADWGRYS